MQVSLVSNLINLYDLIIKIIENKSVKKRNQMKIPVN